MVESTTRTAAGRRLRAALGFVQLPATEPELLAAAPLARLLDGPGVGRRGDAAAGVGPSAHRIRGRPLAGDVLRERDGPLDRRRVGVGADAVAGGAAGGWEALR